jgi:hypothetical protein
MDVARIRQALEAAAGAAVPGSETASGLTISNSVVIINSVIGAPAPAARRDDPNQGLIAAIRERAAQKGVAPEALLACARAWLKRAVPALEACSRGELATVFLRVARMRRPALNR